jgi:hypothetical protein
MLLSFYDYIIESEGKLEVTIYYSQRFKNLLIDLSLSKDYDISSVSRALLSLEDSYSLDDIKSDITLIDITEKNNYLSFLQANRAYRKWDQSPDKDKIGFTRWLNKQYSNSNSPLWKEQRSEIRIGVLVKKLLSLTKLNITDSQLEKFVNAYKSSFDLKSNAPKRIELVSGELIRKWYHENNYAESKGQLGSSCMRYQKCQEYLDIYVQNTKVCNLLILYSDNTKNKISARALVWHLTDGGIVVDRIYSNYDSDITLFEEYASKKGWQIVRNLRDDKEIQLEYWNHSRYPYMDNFMCLNINNGILSSDENMWPSKGWIKMQSTDGTYLEDNVVWSNYESDYIQRDEAVWADDIEDWIFGENAIFLEYIDIYVSSRADVCYSEYSEQNYYVYDTVFSEIMNDNLYVDSVIRIQINYHGEEDWIPDDLSEEVFRFAVYEDSEVKTIDKFVILDPTTGKYHFRDETVDELNVEEWILNKLENVQVDFDKIKNYILNSDFSIVNFTDKWVKLRSIYRIYLPILATSGSKSSDLTNLIKYLVIYYPVKSGTRDGLPKMGNEEYKKGLYTSIIEKDSELLNSLVSEESLNRLKSNKSSIFNYLKIAYSFIYDIIQDNEIRTMYFKLKNS